MIRKPLLPAIVVALAWSPWVHPQSDSPPAVREIDVFPSRPIGAGSAVVLRPVGPAATEVIVHFHGGVDAVRRAMERDDGREMVVVLNMPGLSAAYAAPFRKDPALFQTLLAAAWTAGSEPDRPPEWERITLSCFSAGYGAVREILRSPEAGRIDAVVAADSIYAGIEAEAPRRRVNVADMDAFLAFARLAAAGERTFLIAHSAQPTSYASTTETADYLLDSLGLSRAAAGPAPAERFPAVSRCEREGLQIVGYSGESADAHLHHLRILERHWQAARRLARQR